MYSLPITTYTDYWRATRTWSSYLGGLAVLAAGTRYSTLNAPEITQTLQSYQQIKQSPNAQKLKLEISFLDSRWRVLHSGNVSRGAPNLGGGSLRVPSLVQKSSEVENNSKNTAHDSAGTRMSSVTQIVEKEIPFETQVIESDKLLPGMSQIQEEGEKGVLRQVVKTFQVGGQPVDEQIAATFELKGPKKKVVIQNSKPAVGEHFDIEKLNISKTITVESTAYTYTGNKTATGLTPRQGLIAVDPRVIAMGSKVYVEGYGYAIAADTGGDIQGNRVDVFFPNLRQCLDWGRKPVRIHLLKPI